MKKKQRLIKKEEEETIYRRESEEAHKRTTKANMRNAHFIQKMGKYQISLHKRCVPNGRSVDRW